MKLESSKPRWVPTARSGACGLLAVGWILLFSPLALPQSPKGKDECKTLTFPAGSETEVVAMATAFLVKAESIHPHPEAQMVFVSLVFNRGAAMGHEPNWVIAKEVDRAGNSANCGTMPNDRTCLQSTRAWAR